MSPLKSKWVLTICFWLSLYALSAQDAQEKNHVLYINSYAPAYAWSDSITAGIKSSFQERQDIILYVEYLDSKRYGKTLFNHYYELFQAKYQCKNIDVIITSDNNALDFLLEYPELFPNIPVVFSGVNNPQDYDLESHSFYGVLEGNYQSQLLEMIIKVMPDVKTFYFIHDSTESSLIDIANVKKIEGNYKGKIKFEYESHADLNSLLEKVKNFDPQGAIALTDVYSQNKFDPVSPEELIAEVAELSSIPVFDGRESALGKGIVGGVFNNGFKHGKEAAALTITLLDNPGQLKDTKFITYQGKYGFDYEALQKFHIDTERLPEEATIINKPNNLKQYLLYIFVLLVFILFQAVIITRLIRNIHLRKKAEKELHEKYELIQESNLQLGQANWTIKGMNDELEKANASLQVMIEELENAKTRAENSNRLKTEFLNNMSHEVRTPMNGIIGFSRLLEEEDVTDEERKFYSKIVQNSGYQLLRIIDDILEISNLETKQIKVIDEEFCLNDLLSELFSIFSLKTEERNISFRVEKGLSDRESCILSDKSKLSKILSNLLENAVKFTAEGYVEVGYSRKAEELILYVEDTGIGIGAQSKELIFERFCQEDEEISNNYGGLGLGLAICKENAQLLGGHIRVESEKGKGAKFWVSMPYKPVRENVLA